MKKCALYTSGSSRKIRDRETIKKWWQEKRAIKCTNIRFIPCTGIYSTSLGSQLLS